MKHPSARNRDSNSSTCDRPRYHYWYGVILDTLAYSVIVNGTPIMDLCPLSNCVRFNVEWVRLAQFSYFLVRREHAAMINGRTSVLVPAPFVQYV